ncbi:MAG TPA: FHA domain-containing protein [Anaerolineaceae bacterium]|nr:FHA domain-containing protein [Anaerolineaceae bacterium]
MISKGTIDEPITGEYPVLVALQGPLEGKRWIMKEAVIIGREPDCTVSIEDRQVSRQHARLSCSNNLCNLEDLGSKNGTYHNGKQVEGSVTIKDGDTFQVALIQKFVFYSSDATMPMEDLGFPILQGEGKLVLDGKSRRVWVAGKELVPPISAAQFRLLACLYRQAGQVVAREELVQEIWQGEESVGVSDQALDALIRRLRERIAEIDNREQYIITVRGHGVRFENH